MAIVLGALYLASEASGGATAGRLSGAHFGGGRFGGARIGAGHFGGNHVGNTFGGAHFVGGNRLVAGLGSRRFNRNAFGEREGWNRWGIHGGFRGRGWGGGWGGWGWGGWAGPVFWPFVLGDVYSSAFWPYADADDPFWSYGVTFDDEHGDYGPGYGYSGAYSQSRDQTAEPPPDVTQSCGGLAPGVTHFPIGRIRRAFHPTAAQTAALNDLAAAASKARAVVDASCPRAPPLTVLGRLDAAQSRFDAVIRAIEIVRAPFAGFYDSLSDEQRRHLDAIGAAQNQNRPRSVPPSSSGANAPTSSCQQQAASFTQPVAHIERIVQPTAEQQAAVDRLKQASAKATDELLASCSAQPATTPVARLDAMKKHLAVMVNAVQIMRPPLIALYDSLSDKQKAWLDSGAAPTPRGDRAKVGELNCRLSPTVGFIVGSRQRVSCRYVPDGPWPTERYHGHLYTAGLDIGVNGGGRMMWAVFAPVSGHNAGALAGNYVGASADVAVGIGLGTNVLVGGSRRSVALQPVSVEGNTGLDLAVGASRLRLHWLH